MEVMALFEELCLRWAREADLVVQQRGAVAPTLVLLPRDVTADEVVVQVDGLRGNLVERADAIVAELRPAAAPHDPAGLVFVTAVRDDVAVYVSLGRPELRRVLGFRVVPGAGDIPAHLERAETDPPVEHFSWLDALL